MKKVVLSARRAAIRPLTRLALGLFILGLCSCDRALRKENERLREELARAQQYVPLERDTIRDTVEVVTQKIVEVEKIKNVLTAEDKALLSDLKVKVKELESLQKTGMETRDTVFLAATESQHTGDSTFFFKDAWTEIVLEGRRMTYSVKDSLAIAVKREYKHKFLWWKWGVKGYEVKVANFNPHTTIRYNTFVKRKE